MSKTTSRSGHQSPPSMPHWVKLLIISGLSLFLLFAVLQLTGVSGPHGPGRHTSTNQQEMQQP